MESFVVLKLAGRLSAAQAEEVRANVAPHETSLTAGDAAGAANAMTQHLQGGLRAIVPKYQTQAISP